jgi:serine/threonine protein phosphatase PrpC
MLATDLPATFVETGNAHVSLRVAVGHASLAGKRESNQDYVGIVQPIASELNDKGILLAVADGVSGSGGGREAAEYTVRGLLSDYYATPSAWDTAVALDRVLNAINRWLLAQSAAHPEREGMACTLSALILRQRSYTIVHVGDTRVYLLRNGKLTKLTTDHVWDRPEMRHVLTRAIGLDTRLVLDYGGGDLTVGDRFLLVSDGVWHSLGDVAMREALLAAADAAGAAQRLCAAALQAGSQDNVSAAVADVLALPAPELAESTRALEALGAPPRLRAGERIDGYVVQELLHSSRVTLLYKVLDSASGRVCVLKTLTPEAAADAQERAALAHEEWLMRRAVARFFPQHIAAPAERRTYLYLLMTWHEGATLQQKLDVDTHFNVPEALQLAVKLARGVGALHRRQILHRDIKPANVHLGTDGEVRILDLGVAAVLHKPTEALRAHAGTPSFIAPEQYAGAKPSERMDLYALGVTLYHLLTRRYPYGEIEPFQRPKFGEPVPPTRYRADIPPWLENVILKAVAREPKQRFETADEFLLALEQGAARPLAPPPKLPLAQRDPAALWRAVAISAICICILLLYLLVAR